MRLAMMDQHILCIDNTRHINSIWVTQHMGNKGIRLRLHKTRLDTAKAIKVEEKDEEKEEEEEEEDI